MVNKKTGTRAYKKCELFTYVVILLWFSLLNYTFVGIISAKNFIKYDGRRGKVEADDSRSLEK